MATPEAPPAAELAFAPASEQIDLLRDRQVSARELVELCLERIERLDPKLNAFRVVMEEKALAEADRAQERLDGGEHAPLLGLPIAIKDDTDVEGEVTADGTAAYGEPVRADAEIVRRLRAAGAVIVGKTNVPELTAWPFTETETWGATRNPWNPDHTPGGSSGGSAAAVASGMVGIATGSDGGGSLRIPGSNCNLFGLKPQRGRVSLSPLAEQWHGLSVTGCVSHTVLDTALFLDVVRGGAAGDEVVAPDPPRPFAEYARTQPGKLRIAVSTKPIQPGPVHDDVKRAVAETAELLRGLGHEVRECKPPWGLQLPAFLPRYLHGMHLDAMRMPHPEKLDKRTRAQVRMGKWLSPRALDWALRREAKHAARLGGLFEASDVVLTPVIARPPERIGRWAGKGALVTLNSVARYMPFTTPWNVTGQPAASVPAGFSSDGLPIGVQIVGRPNDEGTLLSLAAQIEAERPWADRRPPIA